MTKKKTAPASHAEILRHLMRAGIAGSPEPNRPLRNADHLPTLQQRVDRLWGITNNTLRPLNHMLFFVMYDIESDKVRHQIAKYLERRGCFRIQRSIFMADLDRNLYAEIKNDLTEVQALYQNNDSIVVCPISTDQVRAMKIIGRSINIDIITKAHNTLFF